MYNEDIGPLETLNNEVWQGPDLRLFICALKTPISSFSMIIRSNTHYEAASFLVCYAREDGIIAGLDDIAESAIEVFEVPAIEGNIGAVEGDEINVVLVPKVGLLQFYRLPSRT